MRPVLTKIILEVTLPLSVKDFTENSVTGSK